jgi:hypothetical protein
MDMNENGTDPVEEPIDETLPTRPNPTPGVHYTELPEGTAGGSLAEEWNTYGREVARLLAEGHEGKFVLIKKAAIIGLFPSWDGAYQEGVKHSLLQPMLIHEIRPVESILRVRGYNLPCPTVTKSQTLAGREQRE